MNQGIKALVAVLAAVLALGACNGPSGQSAPSTSSNSTPATSTPADPRSLSTLTISIGQGVQHFTSAELLARSDAVTLTIPHDVAYGRQMSFRAVPLRALLGSTGQSDADTMEIRATDGFVAQLPRSLFNGAATPWLAIEDKAHPWPQLPGKSASAGPFYLIWEHPERAGVSPEQWPYQMASMTAVSSPAQRWPAIAVSSRASPEARHGQAVFAANCLTCHKLAGAGEGNVGPDLMQPMPATSYFTDAGIQALIRNPHNVRTWPEQHMPAFDSQTISDADITAIIAYLHALAANEPQSGNRRR
jgi:mono/diheme cytochrome c family protein